MINQINNTIRFQNNSNSNYIKGKNADNQKFKEDWLKKRYNDQYLIDKKANNTSVKIWALGSLSLAAGSFLAKEQRGKNEWLFSALLCTIASLGCYIFKPQKEKYDAQVQIELNKEVANANNSSK